MADITRRNFLKYGASLASLMGLGGGAVARLAEAAQELAAGNAPVLWLQAQSCSGCSISLLNSQQPGPAEILTRYLSLRFHSNLSTATGEVGMNVIEQTIKSGGYFLVVEGSIPDKMPKACMMGGKPIAELIARAASQSSAVIAVGTCSAMGGIPAAENNPTGAISVPAFLKKAGIAKPVITLPGCPPHPDWIVGTLAHVLKFGLPKLDALGRPEMFYGKILHDQCPRFADYEREVFAQKFSDEGCLFQLGCLGPITNADCGQRLWNGGVNGCIKAGAPCIGCCSEQFAARTDLPFYRKNETTARKKA